VLELAREDAKNLHLRGFIVCESSYPVPWLFGDFSRVGYYARKNGKGEVVPPGTPDFMLVTADRVAEMEARLEEPYFKEMVRIFPGAPAAYAYFRVSVFKHVMAGRTPEFLPGMVSPPVETGSSDDEMESEDDSDN
jgi:hypothetical protein